ncbi:MAG: metallophosphoesterase [Rubrivivax sp.]|nr:metallophosphoesterase [Rubrivivax sp.]MCL4699387.1 metallophosphoesterase [Burkholderiaceae bacterium]
MKLQLLSDLHLETEDFEPAPLAGAELLVLAGDIDATWAAYARFAGWPVPVLVVPGNHEFDGRELTRALPAFRAMCARHGLTLLHRESVVITAADGQRVRFVGTPRWSDFDLFGADQRERAMRAARYFLRLMGGTRGGRPLDAAALREEGLICRAWLETELARTARAPDGGTRWDITVVVTHFGPSLASADPRYGAQPGTASFCNADDDLLPRADLWLHGHLHCRHDYLVPRARRRPTRVVSQARGMADKGEPDGFDAARLIEA